MKCIQESSYEHDSTVRLMNQFLYSRNCTRYIAEIAQEIAMQGSMNVWVDGSLRDHEWYAQRFKNLRKRFPQYKIAILAITASTTVTREVLFRSYSEYRSIFMRRS